MSKDFQTIEQSSLFRFPQLGFNWMAQHMCIQRQSGYRRYLYHRGNEQTTGGTVEAAARPCLIQICPSRHTIWYSSNWNATTRSRLSYQARTLAAVKCIKDLESKVWGELFQAHKRRDKRQGWLTTQFFHYFVFVSLFVFAFIVVSWFQVGSKIRICLT